MEKTILDFSSPDAKQQWETVDDGVMGGLSSVRMLFTHDKTCRFEGDVSLENRGGFASIRTRPRAFNLAGHAGLMIRFKGDGKDYRIRLRTDDVHEGTAYQAQFSTKWDEWMLVRLPFEAFIPVFRGQVVRDAPPLDISSVRRIGFMIADKQPGPFRLEIAWVKAF